MRRLVPTVAALLVLLGCGGGSSGVPDAPDAPEPSTEEEIRLGSGALSLVLDRQGRLLEVRVPDDVRNLAATEPHPVLELEVGGRTLAPESASAVGGDLLATFDGGAASVRLGVEESANHLLLTVVDVQPTTAELLRLRVALLRLDAVDPALNGTYDDEAILALRSVTPQTRCIYRSLTGGVPQPGVEWDAAHGIVGGRAALIATTRAGFFPAVHALATAEGLPAPRFDGVPARASATARESYLFLTWRQAGDVPRILEYAGVAGLARVLVLRDLWRRSEGTYGLDPSDWPGGLAEFQAFCDQLRAGGLDVGLHLYGPSISPDDPLVTPVPHDGLLAWPCPPLESAVHAAATTLPLAATPQLPTPGGGGFPGAYLRLGAEIVRYAGTSAGPPFAFTGCERGALGTTAAPHASGEAPRHLAVVNGLFLIDPDSALVDTVAANLGTVVNATGADMVYFDATAVIPTNDFVQRWYTMNRILPRMYAAFDHDVLVQTGMGPGRELDWFLVPCSASADGHGDIKWYLDRRTPSIESIRRGLTVPDIGWYGFDAGRPPDHLEYVCAKALGWDCGISLQTHVVELENARRARETMEMVGRYERWRRAGGPPQGIRDALLAAGRDFRLLEDAGGAQHLFETTYDPGRDIRTLPAGTHAWSVGNDEGEDRILGVEITRGDAVRTHADFTAGGVVTIDSLTDAAPYTPGGANDADRLVNRVAKIMNDAGPARSGVEHAFATVPDAAVGGQALALVAENANTTIGWCAVGRVFDTPLDLAGHAATGIWIHGDGSGIELSIELYDDSDDRVVVKVPLFFEGWRFHTFPLTLPGAFDASRVTYLVLVAADLPPESTVATRFALLRATPAVTAPADLTGVSVVVGGRTLDLPAPLPPGGTARIDALGRITIWPGGMQPGETSVLPGGPVVVPPGVTPIALSATGPATFPGDVVVRTSRLVRIHP